MGFLAGKRILVTGLLSNRSIAWGIAKAAQREGAELALTYQTDRFKDRVADMAKELGSDIALPCEVTDDASIAQLFQQLGGVAKRRCPVGDQGRPAGRPPRRSPARSGHRRLGRRRGDRDPKVR